MPDNDHQSLATGFMQILVWLTVLGAVGLVGGNIVGSIVVPGHDFVADTVSDLAAGRYEIIQDVSLYGFATSLFALALAAAHVHNGTTSWSILTFTLAFLAVCVVIIGARNEYGDGDSAGIVIHIYIVYALGLLFSVVFAIAGLRGGRIADFIVPVSWVCFVLWITGAPIFFFLPTEWDGLWERGLGVVSVVWAITFALGLGKYCQQRAGRTGYCCLYPRGVGAST